MKMFKILKTGFAGLIGLVFVFVANAADDAKEVKPEDAIKYRQSVYTVIKWNFAPIGAMVKGEIPFDASAVNRHAAYLETLSKMPLEGFIPDSHQGDTRAKPEIWSDWDHFQEHMNQFEEEAAKLAEIAKTGDEAAIKKQFGATGKSCKSCHDNFRKEKQ